MKIFFAFSTLCFFTANVLSCSKNATTESGITKTTFITSASWRLDDIGADQNRDGKIDASAFGLLPDCSKDNTITFKSDNTGITDEGAVICSSTTPTAPFNWNFADAETNIKVTNSTFGSINGTSKIIELNASSLSLTKDSTIGGITTAFIVKLKH